MFVLTSFTGESYDRFDHRPEAVESMQLAESLPQFDNYQLHAVAGCKTFLRGVRSENRIVWNEEFYGSFREADKPILELLKDQGVQLS